MKRARPLLGTIVEITADGEDDHVVTAIDAAFEAIETVHRLMSFHEPNSDVSRINRAEAGIAVEIDPHSYRVITFAYELSELSAGCFDITTAPVLVESGFLPRDSHLALPKSVTYRDLELLPDRNVRWHHKSCIDLGGIAKGYAVDCAVTALRSKGIKTAIVNAGGDLRCFGAAQHIYLRHPSAPQAVLQLGWLSNGAFATSAGYFSGLGLDEERIDPLVDPRRRSCTLWGGSISVAAADCMTADALTKIIRLSPATAPMILEHFQAQTFVIDTQGTRCCGYPWLQREEFPNDAYAPASNAAEQRP